MAKAGLTAAAAPKSAQRSTLIQASYLDLLGIKLCSLSLDPKNAPDIDNLIKYIYLESRRKFDMLCPTCQTAIQTNWYFCRQCGTALAAREAQPIVADSSLNDNLLGAIALLSQPGQPQRRQSNDVWDTSDWSEWDLFNLKHGTNF